jgi:hypothetical protein
MSDASPVVLCAQAVGYGPAAKLLAVAGRLRAAGVRPVFLGTGIAHELASRSSDLGDAVEAGASDPRARRLVGGAAAVLSVMDAGYARLALELSRPLHVADSLAWLRHPVPPEFLAARRYFVQDFCGVREHLRGISPQPTLVGPIVGARRAAAEPERSRLVVNLGGYDTPYVSCADDCGYADFVVRGLLESGLPAAFSGEAVLMAGARCAESLARRFGGGPLCFVSLARDEAEDLAATAAAVLTAPGLTSTLECFRSGTPTFFLPPQNYSQWWILEKLRAAGLAPCALHWADHLRGADVVERMSLAARVPVVRRAIRHLTGDARVRRSFREALGGMASQPRQELARAQAAWFASLGSDGAAAIASELIAESINAEGERRRWIA